MKIFRNKKRFKDVKMIFSSFVFSFMVISCFFTLFYVYKEAEEKGMGAKAEEKEQNVPPFLPYEIFDLTSYLV